MRFIYLLCLCLTVSVISGCVPSMPQMTEKAITGIIVMKEKRQLYLMHDNRIIKRYQIDLGFSPLGHKAIEGDGKTPEGHYVINRNNPQSRFHLSLGMSYPNNKDRSRAYATVSYTHLTLPTT